MIISVRGTPYRSAPDIFNPVKNFTVSVSPCNVLGSPFVLITETATFMGYFMHFTERTCEEILKVVICREIGMDFSTILI